MSILGYGNVGSGVARLLGDRGYKIAGLADSKSAIFNKKGLDLKKVNVHKEKTGSFKGFRGADHLTLDELIASQVDILVPASVEGQLKCRKRPYHKGPDRSRRRERPDHTGGRPDLKRQKYFLSRIF